jgi:repressor LexA
MQTEHSFSTWFTEAFKMLDVTPSEVATRIGIPNAKIYNIVNGKFRPGYETIQQILEAYPRLNANYLMKGQLPILHISGAEIVTYGSIESLKLPLFLAPNFNPSSMNVTETYPVLTNGKPVDQLLNNVVIRLTDNSMSPRFVADTYLQATPVPAADWEYLNSVYVAVLYRNTFVVRRIRENELLTRNYLTLYAESADSGFVHVKREDLQSIWRIVSIVSGGVE